jgi:hypothetical protein
MQHEGGGIPPTTGGALSFTQAIVVTTRDANHLRIIAEVSTRLGERRSQWCEVDGKKINACGKGVRVWGFPTPGFKQPAGRSIHVEPPWREHAHMAPFADGAAGFGPGFKDARAQTAFNEVSGGGEADWATPDDGDRQGAIKEDGIWHRQFSGDSGSGQQGAAAGASAASSRGVQTSGRPLQQS